MVITIFIASNNSIHYENYKINHALLLAAYNLIG